MTNFFEWFQSNKDIVFELVAALILLLEIIVNLTPSDNDNSVLLKIKNAIAFIFPNRKKQGGTHG